MELCVDLQPRPHKLVQIDIIQKTQCCSVFLPMWTLLTKVIEHCIALVLCAFQNELWRLLFLTVSHKFNSLVQQCWPFLFSPYRLPWQFFWCTVSLPLQWMHFSFCTRSGIKCSRFTHWFPVSQLSIHFAWLLGSQSSTRGKENVAPSYLCLYMMPQASLFKALWLFFFISLITKIFSLAK